MMFTTPPVVLAPNSVPCGPRRISTRSMSKRSASPSSFTVWTTPSTTVPTSVPTYGEGFATMPMPRITYEIAFVSPALTWIWTLGMLPVMSFRSWMCSDWIASAVTADTEIGTSCMFSARFCAVTTTSSRPVAVSAAGAWVASIAREKPTPAVAACSAAVGVFDFDLMMEDSCVVFGCRSGVVIELQSRTRPAALVEGSGP
jgi:hypothetical protein